MEGQSRRGPLVSAINGPRAAEWSGRCALPVDSTRLDRKPPLPQQIEHTFRPAKMQRTDRHENRPIRSRERRHPHDKPPVTFVDDAVVGRPRHSRPRQSALPLPTGQSTVEPHIGSSGGQVATMRSPDRLRGSAQAHSCQRIPHARENKSSDSLVAPIGGARQFSLKSGNRLKNSRFEPKTYRHRQNPLTRLRDLAQA